MTEGNEAARVLYERVIARHLIRFGAGGELEVTGVSPPA